MKRNIWCQSGVGSQPSLGLKSGGDQAFLTPGFCFKWIITDFPYIAGCNNCLNSFLIKQVLKTLFVFRKLRRVCRQCLHSDKKLKSELVEDPQGIDDDAKSDVSELSQRTGSMLSETGGLDPNDGPSTPQPGKCRRTNITIVVLVLDVRRDESSMSAAMRQFSWLGTLN